MKNNKQFVAKQNYTQDEIKNNPLDLLHDNNLLNDDASFNDFYVINDKNNNVLEKLNLSDFINKGISLLQEEYKTPSRSAQSEMRAMSAQSEYGAMSAQSGMRAMSAQSGNRVISAQSEYGAMSAQSGMGAMSVQTKEFAMSAQSGHFTMSSQNGDYSMSSQNGDYSMSSQNGWGASSTQSGNYSTSYQSGRGASSAQSGMGATSVQTKRFAKSTQSGHFSNSEIYGEDSISFNCGRNGLIKGISGTWISLAEYEKDSDGEWKPCFALSAQIGNENYRDFQGNMLEENQFYCLINHNFAKCEVISSSVMVIIKSKKVGEIQLLTTQYLTDMNNKIIKENCYVAKNGEYSAHGETVREAISELQFKILDSGDVQDHVKRVKEQGFLTAQDYRLIAKTCRFGTSRFLEANGFDWDTKKTIDEVIELTKNQYGHDKLVDLLKNDK